MSERAGLLDVNVLLALAWRPHQYHGVARAWFEAGEPRSWCTCPITAMGFVRLSSHPSFSSDCVTPGEAAELLLRLTRRGAHRALVRAVSVLDPEFAPLRARLQGPRQVTDAVLLATAHRHDVDLVTFDHRLALLSPYPERPLVIGPD